MELDEQAENKYKSRMEDWAYKQYTLSDHGFTWLINYVPSWKKKGGPFPKKTIGQKLFKKKGEKSQDEIVQESHKGFNALFAKFRKEGKKD